MITLYRDNCERLGILTTDSGEEKEEKATCPICEGEMMRSGGCEECVDCGYSPCAV